MPETNNPYVGPRSFTRKDAQLYFGREREARDLLSLVISQRLVLFYAQSGAGKSSLINTRLIPQLQEEGFVVLPVGRVSGDLPERVDQVENIFAFNLMLGLDQSKGDPKRLQELCLTDFLANLSTNDGEYFFYDQGEREEIRDYRQPPHVLIIDQFEEIFTTNLEHWDQRGDFFRQLDEALDDDPLLWMVLVLREDYVAALDPYAPLMTNNMRARFYMRRMGHEAALEAVKKPAEKRGHPFAPDVAESLVDNMRLIRSIESGDGEERFISGEFVEPVQLQVVCYQLWEDLDFQAGEPIKQEDLNRLAGGTDLALYVNKAITEFYNRALAKVLEKTDVSERRLRNWFSQELITEAETRGYIYQGEEFTGSLPNEAVQVLENQYILRSEPKAGGTWIELVHDRFIGPILRANREWQAQNQNPLILDAQAWKDSGKDPKMLYEGAQLERALVESKADEQPQIVEEFLQRGQQAAQEKAAARQRRITQAAIALVIILIGLTSWAVAGSIAATRNARSAEVQRAEAVAARSTSDANAQEARDAKSTSDYNAQMANQESTQAAIARATSDASALIAKNAEIDALEQKDIAEAAKEAAVDSSQLALSRNLAALGNNFLDKQLDLGLLLAIEAYNTRDTLEARSAILNGILRRQTFTINPLNPVFPQESSDIISTAFSPDGAYLAWGTAIGEVTLWDLQGRQIVWTKARSPGGGHSGAVRSVAFSPDGSLLASAGDDTTIRLWQVKGGDLVGKRLETGSIVNSLSFDQQGFKLAAGVGPEVQLWDVASGEREKELRGPADVQTVAWSPDGKWLAAGGSDARVWIWNISLNQDQGKPLIRRHNQTITSLAWSPDPNLDGPLLASAGEDRYIYLWNVDSGELLGELPRTHSQPIRSIAFSKNGDLLASTGEDGDVIVWDLATRESVATLKDSQLSLNTIAFNPAGRNLIAAGGFEDRVYLYEVITRQALSTDTPLQKGSGAIQSLAFTATGKFVAARNARNNTSLWEVSADGSQENQLPNSEQRGSISALSADGEAFALLLDDKTIQVDHLTSDETSEISTVNPPTSLALSTDGGLMAFGLCGETAQGGNACQRSQIILWDVNKSQAIYTLLTPQEDLITSLAFNREANRLASGSQDGSITLWNLQTGEQIGLPLQRHTSAVTSLAFSPDGEILASGSQDLTIILWDATSGQPIGKPLFNQVGAVTSLAFSPQGDLLASGSQEGGMSLWNVDVKSWTQIACQIANRNLTVVEWDQFIPQGSEYRKTCPEYDLQMVLSTPTPIATLQPPEKCSVEGQEQIGNTWNNDSSDRYIDFFWIDYQCNEVYYGTLAPGESLSIVTYKTHPWLFRDRATGEQVDFYVATEDGQVIDLLP